MQEIIKNSPQDFDVKKFYGFQTSAGKSFVYLDYSDSYAVKSFDSINKLSQSIQTPYLRGIISNILDIGTVFEFETHTDLLKWAIGLENKGKKIENYKNAISLSDITKYSEGAYFGVLGMARCEKFFIAQEGYHKGKFKAVCKNGLTYSNYFCDSESDTLKGCIENVLDRNAKVFKFDSCTDLFAWLAK